MTRDALVHTFGVLLAGMFEAEKSRRDETRRRRRTGSGVFPLPAQSAGGNSVASICGADSAFPTSFQPLPPRLT